MECNFTIGQDQKWASDTACRPNRGKIVIGQGGAALMMLSPLIGNLLLAADSRSTMLGPPAVVPIHAYRTIP